jgi:hypothetical protein
MATRFYLHKGSGAFFTPSITPIFHPEWDAVDNAVRRLATTEKLGSVVATTTTISEASSAAPYDFLFGQFISFPLLAQTISGDISGVIRSRETTTAGDFNYAFCAKVVSEDGTIIRGTLFEGFPGSITTEMYYTQLRNWYMPPLSAMTPVVCQNGDRIVFEIGVRSFNTSGLSIGAEINFDDINATDLVYNQTGSTHGAPWVELSGDIGFITSANLDSFQVDVEYIDDHIELDSLQVDVEYGETLAILDQFYVDVEYEESTISEIDNDSLQVDVEYEELPLLKLNKI